MKWTKEKPKVEGWYWHKGHNERVKVVEVLRFKFRLRRGDDKVLGYRCLPEAGGKEGGPVSREPGMWAGPIPEPEEER